MGLLCLKFFCQDLCRNELCRVLVCLGLCIAGWTYFFVGRWDWSLVLLAGIGAGSLFFLVSWLVLYILYSCLCGCNDRDCQCPGIVPWCLLLCRRSREREILAGDSYV